MSLYNSVQIGAWYLTDDGTEDGIPAKADVTNLDKIFSQLRGNTMQAADDTAHTFVHDYAPQGAIIVITPLVEFMDNLSELSTILEAAAIAGTAIPCVFDGDTGVYEVDCKPYFKSSEGILPINFSGKFVNGRIYDVRINLISHAITA